ncbi:methyltransferase [Rhodopirellula sp. MGV]|uniref:methyltransferase n=1 Tax=Rhodopirellula sp. MGV TaxID=2023130 RepID=UPI000B974CFD|nr:methyltransferase [Rhodopirellula sp. MGV]OYP37754.1 hypothetical protein CGZ80_04545 [Rhodopirellula sp. MGV]PNY37190.1 hypothetical protein C2E31_09405 [Rhodopirellula baltica]
MGRTSDSATLDTTSTLVAGVSTSQPVSTKNTQSSGTTPPTDRSAFVQLCRGFIRYHASPLNVTLHCLTTPMAVLGVYLIASWIHPNALAILPIGHAIWIAALAPAGLASLSALLIAGLSGVAWIFPDQVILGSVLLVVGYVGQEAAHWFTGEATFQSSYRGSVRWLRDFSDHTILLLPLLIVSATRRKSTPLRLLVARQAVLTAKLSPEIHRQDFDTLLNWVRQRTPTLESSTHWWQHDLEGDAGEAFSRLSADETLLQTIRRFHGPGYEVRPAYGMNEVYVTGPPKKISSDTVFYMGHVDGPWGVFPGASLYRCMLALNENLEVTTHYPMAGLSPEQPVSYRLRHGDAAIFDFNRELHYITRELRPDQPEPRINLKLHFVAYPKTCRWYGKTLEWLTTKYDISARHLFLQTIRPDSWFAGVKARWVLAWTKIFELIVQHVGWTNLAYVALAGLVSAFMVLVDSVSSLGMFLAATSFVHYAIYLGTLHERSRIAFARFRRDAMFFKTLSLGQLFVLYAIAIFSGQLGLPEMFSLFGVMAGFSLAGWSAKVLGMTRTLYSSELGFEKPQRITRAPFGTISHPMIIGAAIGIASMGLAEGFRASFGWLIIGHLVCYASVLAQEVAVHRRWEKSQEFPAKQNV